MQVQDWHDDRSCAAFACQIHCPDGRAPGLQLIFNPQTQSLPFRLTNGPWALLLDSSGVLAPQSPVTSPLIAPARCLLLLRAL